MRITVNKELLLFWVLLASFFVPGILGEALFWISVLLLVCCNRKHALRSRLNRQMAVVLLLYAALFVAKLCSGLGASTPIRLLGITKCCAGIPICLLFMHNLVKRTKPRLIFCSVVLIGILFVVTCDIQNGITHIRFGFLKWILGIGTINMCGGIVAVTLPLFLMTKGMTSRLGKILLLAVFVLVYLTYPSGSLLGVFALIVLLSLLYCERAWFSVKVKTRLRERFFTAFVVIAVIAVIALTVYFSLFDLYVDQMQRMDIARYNILRYAIQEFSGFSLRDKLFGIGDNAFYLGLNYTSAHNMIMEVLRVYGISGLITAGLEFLAIAGYLISIRKMECFIGAVCSAICLYLFFMLHPYYATSMILKLFYVMVNYTAVYREAKKNRSVISTGESCEKQSRFVCVMVYGRKCS